ncbi:uncharacterized protein BX663DRAFT_479047 [Cokeromyces recurvatus]|uniref:uncharacterized protein n=1 Tax=Cokeromyces recurvatus TaxID=90255 RepID=UPI002220AEE5|nr:uncharacterized protein BX663DRAFT_479047 [Cokeromyces recurvatus]KAI7898958.1 hypothetical protein BX663DRAFT_479047 [Cokeromyces recurvatus]
MKFTPNIDKFAVLHDASKKIHVTFEDDPVTDNSSKKRSHSDNDKDSKKKVKKSIDKKEEKKKKVEKKDAVPITAPTTQEQRQQHKSAVPISVPSTHNTTSSKKKKFKVNKKPLTQEEILAKVAAIRKKKQLKRQAKVKINGELVAKPTFRILPEGLKTMISTKQLGEFILYALSETTPLTWCSIIHKAKVNHVVMVYAQGLNCTDFGVSEETSTGYVDLNSLKSEEWIGKAAMPFLTSRSQYMILNQISGHNGRFNSPVADILQCNMSYSKRERLAAEKSEKIRRFHNNMREFYVLTLEEMKRADYPIPPFLDANVTLPEGWKETHPAIDTTAPAKQKRLVAVDCEMVLTEMGSTLARITLIDEDGSVLLDELVKPDAPVIDYLTQYSGITPAAMSEATCSLRRAQKHVRKIVNHDTILVGHGLENDLKAMKLAHPYCVDTSLLYDHHRGPPYKPSLKFLTRTYLKRTIQHGGKGHDSAEDARATMDLFKLKLANKPSFGKFKKTELIFDRLQAFRPPRTSAILESSTSEHRSFGSTEAGEYYRVDTDEELVDLTLSKLPTTHFLFTRWQAADTVQCEKEEGPDVVVPSAATAVSKDRAVQLQTLDDYLRRLYEGLPENSFLVVSGGVRDVPEYKKLYERYRQYQEKYGNKKHDSIPVEEQWIKEDYTLLCKYASKARMSTSFVIFKSIS